MAIVWHQQVIEVTDVENVVVTEIAQDPETGNYVREIRIFTASGASGETQQQQVVGLRLSNAVRNKIRIVVPQYEF